MNDIYEAINKKFPQNILLSDEDYKELHKLIYFLKRIRATKQRQEFSLYIRREWINCRRFRNCIDLHGKDHVYDYHLSHLSIRLGLYEAFCCDLDICYCEQNCYGNNNNNEK